MDPMDMELVVSKHWIPSIADLELLMPARKVKNNPFSVTGRVATLKNKASQDAESMLEQDFLTLLEFDTRVSRYAAQPFYLLWKDKKGRERRYAPDVFVEYHKPVPGYPHDPIKPTVFEVKPYAVLRKEREELIPKFWQARQICRDVGWRFRVITERQIRTPLLDNARFLLRYKSKPYLMAASEPFNLERMNLLRRKMHELCDCTPFELLRRITTVEKHQIEFIPLLWLLVADGAIGCDLSQKLTMTSKIWSMESKDAVESPCSRSFRFHDLTY